MASTHKFTQKLQNRLKWAYKKAKEVNTHARAQHKNLCDRKVKSTKPEIGDTVLVQEKAFKGKHKISAQWENDHYTII